MPYEQIQSGLTAEEERRKRLRQQIAESLSGMGETQMVSGRAVPMSPLTGLSKIGQALLMKRGLTGSEEETERLLEQQQSEKKQAIEDVMNLYTGVEGQPQVGGPLRYGEGEEYQEFQPAVEGIEADPLKAALLASSSPYTEDLSSILSSQLKGATSTPKPIAASQGFYGYTDQGWQPITSPEGEVLTPAFADPELAGRISQQRTIGKGVGEKVVDKPKKEMEIEAATEKTGNIKDLISTAKEQAEGYTTTGFIGQITSGIGGTPAHNLANTLNSIKANIGFDKLQEMRANSPTGGALGQVSEQENLLLQAVWGSVQQSQTEAQLVENLNKLDRQIEESWNRIREAYKKDYGVEYESTMQPKQETDIEALLQKY